MSVHVHEGLTTRMLKMAHSNNNFGSILVTIIAVEQSSSISQPIDRVDALFRYYRVHTMNNNIYMRELQRKIFAWFSNWILRRFHRKRRWWERTATLICTLDEKRNTIYQRCRANFGAEYAIDCTRWICNAFSNLYLWRKEFYWTVSLGRFCAVR